MIANDDPAIRFKVKNQDCERAALSEPAPFFGGGCNQFETTWTRTVGTFRRGTLAQAVNSHQIIRIQLDRKVPSEIVVRKASSLRYRTAGFPRFKTVTISTRVVNQVCWRHCRNSPRPPNKAAKGLRLTKAGHPASKHTAALPSSNSPSSGSLCQSTQMRARRVS